MSELNSQINNSDSVLLVLNSFTEGVQLLIAKETRISQGKGCLSFCMGGPNANSYRNLIALVISQG